MFSYDNLVSRNFPLLSNEEQEKLREIRVGIAGCGMGSFIAEALCRLGVEHFVLADPDIVEEENLNHQAYFIEHVDEKKVVSLKNILLGINPGAKVEIWIDFIRPDNATDFVNRCDIVIDGIDPVPGISASLELARACRRQKKFFLYPIDVGWGAILFCLNPSGETFEDLLGVPRGITPQELEKISVWKLMFNMAKRIRLNPYFLPVLGRVVEGEIDHYPQPIIAAWTASVLTVSAVIKNVKGIEVPFVIQFDPMG